MSEIHVLVTGASGFIASGLVDRLLETGRAGDREFDGLTLADVNVPDLHPDSRVRTVQGSLTEAAVRADALAQNPDVIFHLASIAGRATEQDVSLGYSVNVSASVALFDDIAAKRSDATVVFTGSIGVYGTPVPHPLDDDTFPRPTMSYGAQKLMAEIAFADMVRRELFRGRCIRLSSVLARPRTARSAQSFASYVSDVFYAISAGEPFVFPVEPAATSWLMSRARCVDNLQHAATPPALVGGHHPVCTLPALQVRMSDLARELGAHYGRPDIGALISYQPVPSLQAQFGDFPASQARLAESLGFRHDGSVAELVERVGIPRTREAVGV